jgi:hypothetical protein
MTTGDRHVVLGLARPSRPWFGEVARWTTASALPAEFVKCLSAEELRARLASGRAYSAVLVDAGLPGVDRDLADRARAAGCALLLVDDPVVARDGAVLGAAATLPASFGRAELLAALDAHATRIGRGEAVPAAADHAPPGWRGALVAVTGGGGTGASVTAMALAQGFGHEPRHRGLVLLADLALHADQAVLHHAGDVVPGLQELVEAHRSGTPSPDDVRATTFAVPGRGYSLLLGLRRHRDWAALRPRAVEATIDGLRRSYRVVVADIDPDVEGESETGSVDVGERNALARCAATAADVVVACGRPGPAGVHRLVGLVGRLLDLGVDPARMVTAVTRAPRSPRRRAAITKAIGELTSALGGARLASPVFVPERRHLDDEIHDARSLPAALVAPLVDAVGPLLDAGGHSPVAPTGPEPVPVAPGSVGRWTE